ncbi:hypothetical protein [Salipaludibacillus neizhouensis]|nr:hypothetical protein [Salipaludibacillus neizhouensis]
MWSIALPGFGQILNKQVLKGIVLIILEFLVNVQSNFNLGIMYSFRGEISAASEVLNYQWLMFYPCLYMFAIWDAYQDADGEVSDLAYLPFVFGAFFITIGLMYSSKIVLFGILLGPVFLPMLFLIPGLLIGYIVRKIVVMVT